MNMVSRGFNEVGCKSKRHTSLEGKSTIHFRDGNH